MSSNFLKITLRNIQRFKVNSLINLSGLAIGMACCIFIFLYLQHELSYDSFHENAGTIYRVAVEYVPGGQPVKYAVVPGPVGPALASEFPEVVAAVRFWRDITLESMTVEYGRNVYNEERFFFADSNVFEVFSFPFREGDPETALGDPFAVVITEDMARRYFHDENPIGKVITVNMGTAHDFKVTGILKNIPRNSHIRFDFLASMASLSDIQGYHLMNWRHASFYTYLMLQNQELRDSLEGDFPSFLRNHYGDEESARMKLFLQPLRSIHLHSHLEDELEINGNISHVYAFSVVAFFVLLIACINFMNLTLAQYAARTREVGIRKVLGAYCSQLVRQFLGESFVFALFALVIALSLVEICLPGFNRLTGEDLVFRYGSNLTMILVLIGIIVFVGFISGIYPSFRLSTYETAGILRGKPEKIKASALLRKTLVVVQFAISIILIIVSALIYEQLHFVKNKRLGFSKELVVVMPMRERHMQLNYEFLKQDILRDSRIISATASSNIPFGPVIPQRREFLPEGARKDDFSALFCIFVDQDYLKTFGITLIKGENFSPSIQGTSFILNETAVHEIGWDDPIGKKLAHWAPQTGTVIGVVQDFNFMSLHHRIEPLVLFFSPQWFQYFSVRIQSDDVPGTLAFIEKKWRDWFPRSPFEYSFLDNHVGEQYRADNRLGSMIGIFSLVAIFIACIGLFGLTSITIEERKKEI
ncbi:ABC transporter permease, partial [bacterium]|nr:ABC transporter permease [bacterium]